tara:strand:- start:302 stop:553 length:252 start_codon:yes stop_codon:yes gene_type:complete
MKLNPESSSQFLIGTAGAIAISLPVSFGWYASGSKMDTVLQNHSIVLFAAGVGLLAASFFIRKLSARISVLEAQLSALNQNKG